jgi:hypothetical protein
MGGTITMTVTELIGVIAGIVVPVCGAVVFLYKTGEKKNKVIVDLTKSFVESTKDHAKAIENNTRVIENLPEQIILHLKAMR